MSKEVTIDELAQMSQREFTAIRERSSKGLSKPEKMRAFSSVNT